MTTKEHKIIFQAEALCRKFVKKVQTGRARSKETYAECIDLLRNIEGWKDEDRKRAEKSSE